MIGQLDRRNRRIGAARRAGEWCAAWALLLVAATGAGAQTTAVNPHEGNAAAVRAGRALFANRCAECHGPDATGISGPDLTELWAAGAADGRVFETIRAGVPGTIMPSSTAPEDEIWALVSFLKSVGTVSALEFATGDAGHGREVFFETCATCHRAEGRGGRLGPDLSRITRTRSRAGLTAAIRDPSASMRVGYRAVTVVTADGREIRGVKKGEDAFSIQMLDTGERLQAFLKADLREVRDETASLMPVFGVEQLSDRELDDLLRFLASVSEAGAAAGGAR